MPLIRFLSNTFLDDYKSRGRELPLLNRKAGDAFYPCCVACTQPQRQPGEAIFTNRGRETQSDLLNEAKIMLSSNVAKRFLSPKLGWKMTFYGVVARSLFFRCLKTNSLASKG